MVFSRSLPIALYNVSSVNTELIHVSICWSDSIGMSRRKGPYEMSLMSLSLPL